MKHLNYCRQLAQFLEDPRMRKAPGVDDVHSKQVALLCRHTAKFALPTNGIVLHDEEFRAIEGGLCELPFPAVALEFPCDLLGAKHKAIVFAWDAGDGHIHCQYARNKGSVWGFACQMLIPKDGPLGDAHSGWRSIVMAKWPHDDERPADKYGPSILLGFLNALSCSNVHIERSEPRNSGKKIKAALPFDAYHVLTIDVSGKAGDGAATGGHRSPREHMRRGHIRRLGDGRRIWVNATVVAAGRGAGVVTKDYAVRAGAGT